MVIVEKHFIKNVTISDQIYLLLNQLMDKFLEDILLNLGLLIIEIILLTLNLSYLVSNNIGLFMDVGFICDFGGDSSANFHELWIKKIIFLMEVRWITEKGIISLIMNYPGERTVLK